MNAKPLTSEELADIRSSAEFDAKHVGAFGCAVRKRADATLRALDRLAELEAVQRQTCNCAGCDQPSNPERTSMPRCDWCMLYCPISTGEHVTPAARLEALHASYAALFGQEPGTINRLEGELGAARVRISNLEFQKSNREARLEHALAELAKRPRT